MSMLWAWPLGLAALAAVVMPIWLHLDRRRSMRVLRFAAMRFIGTAHPPKRTWRLTEWLLLALRVLLIVAVVVWLAQPTWVAEWRAPQRVLAVAPGVPVELISAHADGMDRALWLNSELAEIDLAGMQIPTIDPDGSVAKSHPPVFSSLLRQLDAELAPGDQLRVLVGEQVSGLDAQAIALSREVEWRTVRTESSASGASTDVDTPLPRSVAIRYASADAPALPWLRAAIKAWDGDVSIQVTVDEQASTAALPDEVDALIWLGDAPDDEALALLDAGTRLLHLHLVDGDGEPAADVAEAVWPGIGQRVGHGWLTRVSDRFEASELPILHSPEFPAALFTVLFGEPPAPTRAYADQIEPTQISRPAEPSKTPLRPWLIWLIASLFLLERALANGRRLRGTP
ncbi:MAG: BatA domain-containing protein [Pseudomarimonas sp.]